MADEPPTVFSGSGYSHPKTWEALVELARAIVTFNDRDEGAGCSTASVHVSSWGMVDDPKRRDQQMELMYVDLTLTIPASLVNAALLRAGVLKDDDQLGKDQETRFRLLEME